MECEQDNIAGFEEFSKCCCGSTNLKELKPHGIESVQCRDCHVSLRKQDWNRVMGSHLNQIIDLLFQYIDRLNDPDMESLPASQAYAYDLINEFAPKLDAMLNEIIDADRTRAKQDQAND